MGSGSLSHQLSNGLYVSGRPEQPKEKTPAMSSTSMPYTGGDVRKSGELGKMFVIPIDGSRPRKSGPINNPVPKTGSFGGAATHSGPIANNSNRSATLSSVKKSNSGPLNKHGEPLKKSSGPQPGTAGSRQNSGPIPLPTTGLITSGPITTGSLNLSGAPRKESSRLDSSSSVKLHGSSIAHRQAVTTLSEEEQYSFLSSFPKPILWVMVMLFVMGFIAGGFILGAVHNLILLIVVVVLFASVAAAFGWNAYWGGKAITSFIANYSDSDLRTAKDGDFVKVSGVITCGNVPLESSFQRVPRCVYTSTGLYEYRGWDSKAANPKHRRFTWSLRFLERHVVDFYISDFQSGLRALVKTGYGAKVAPFVDESTIVEINPSATDISPEFLRWLTKRNLSCNDREMRLKEGYIKEGSAVSVMGIIQRNDNVLMIIPTPDPIPTGWRWAKCLFPANVEGLVLRCEDTSNSDLVIPV